MDMESSINVFRTLLMIALVILLVMNLINVFLSHSGFQSFVFLCSIIYVCCGLAYLILALYELGSNPSVMNFRW